MFKQTKAKNTDEKFKINHSGRDHSCDDRNVPSYDKGYQKNFQFKKRLLVKKVFNDVFWTNLGSF